MEEQKRKGRILKMKHLNGSGTIIDHNEQEIDFEWSEEDLNLQSGEMVSFNIALCRKGLRAINIGRLKIVLFWIAAVDMFTLQVLEGI